MSEVLKCFACNETEEESPNQFQDTFICKNCSNLYCDNCFLGAKLDKSFESCNFCSDYICYYCVRNKNVKCSICNTYLCEDCNGSCVCDYRLCENCREKCDDCNKFMCAECKSDNSICRKCEENRSESD